MHGIDAVLMGFHINRDNIVAAVQAVNNLNLSVNTVNHFIAESIHREADGSEAMIERIEDVDQARAVLALMVRTGIQKNVLKFSLDSLEEFKNRAKSFKREDVPNPQSITIYANQTNDGQPPAVSAIEKAQPKVDSSNPPPIAKPAVVQAPPIAKPAVVQAPPKVKGTRNRKANPNSNLSRAKAFYASVSDKSRDAIVALFQKELGIEQGTATTYYYLAKKG